MQITRAGEYGVLGLMCLARRPVGAVVMIDEVSREEHIPKSFAGKIFQSLAKAGLVKSNRGSGGGFALLKPAKFFKPKATATAPRHWSAATPRSPRNLGTVLLPRCT